MRKTTGFLAAAFALAGVWACSDLGERGSITEVEALGSHVPGCDLRPVMDAARRYLSPPQQQQVTEKLRQIQSGGCAGEEGEKLAWEVLAIVEHVFYGRLGGAAADGARLVNGVLHCCIPLGSGVTIAEQALGPGGALGVRGALAGASPSVSDTDPVLARDAVPIVFGSEDGSQVARPAVFAARPRPPHTWQDVALGSAQPGTFIDDVTMIAGFPAGGAPHLAYQLDEAPDLGFQPGTQVDVIVCFTDLDNAPPDPHGPDGDRRFAARMKKGGLLLQTVPDAEAFCQQWVWGPMGIGLATRTASVSPLASLFRWAGRLLLPEPLLANPLLAALTDVFTPALGGSAGAFSPFGPTNADTNGALTFLQGPPEVVTSTTTEFSLAVKAASGGGAAMEHVEVTLSLRTNQGVPGAILGTFTGCDGGASSEAVACTEEPNGVASFTVTISKAGGYILCAQGSLEGFGFPEVCTERFHVRN